MIVGVGYDTIIIPNIVGCNIQWYSMVAVLSNTCLNFSSEPSNPESKPLGTADEVCSVTVWIVKSLVVDTMIMPAI